MRENVNQITDDVNLTLKQILEYEIFSLGKYSLSVYEIAAAVIVILIGILIVKVTRKVIYRSDRLDLGKKFAFSQILQYAIFIITFFIAMKALGINISPLLVGSGAILVGIGLGLQNLFLDFISGVIILVDRTIKVGDVIDIDGIVGRVDQIHMRTTSIITRDNKSMIFPNSVLTKEKLINFSHTDEMVRFDIEVGVHYDTDIDLATRILMEAAMENDFVFKNELYQPVVRLENFGDSSLDLKLFYFSKELFRAPQTKNEIRRLILAKFRENGIVIPYPIRTVEFPKL
ncbi:mechanosensitive ion channel family protein [Riemerella anatipestifer]|uniref:mechanosensitive ion channel family protein n=2 Tax=Riemerella anatipestifer TaxID=34085 RepID=UPI00129E1CF5|nr:mechanosensitive ion channel domain-containing protein [Riemerella anatipestifer]MRM83523.1 mechanosensitive ion channel protein MscS [Riemerella anatipestifer]